MFGVSRHEGLNQINRAEGIGPGPVRLGLDKYAKRAMVNLCGLA